MRSKPVIRVELFATLLFGAVVAGCSGGSGGGDATGVDQPAANCQGSCADASSFLSAVEVEQVIAQGVAEAQGRNVNATIAVVDRVGNVLAVFRMGDAASRPVLIASSVNAAGEADIATKTGLEGLSLPTVGLQFNLDGLAAIAKAITGAYLSSEGNAFSTRTASQIVQENFNPGERDQPGGPLFGVQFSQLACSDFSQRFAGPGAGPGPQRSPLGLSADPGGLPLYKGGTVVGGVGVLADGLYAADKNIADRDQDLDELIAVAASFGFAAPPGRRGERITVDGKTFRYLDAGFADLLSDPASAPAFIAIASSGALIAVPGYVGGGAVRAGTAFGTPGSGIRPDVEGQFAAALDAFVFVDAANQPRFPPRAGSEPAGPGFTPLAASEVRTVLSSALGVANRARAQIRQPLNTPARVTVAVVDTRGEILGMIRSRDAPVFGADVSLQKARSATVFSSPDLSQFLTALPDAVYKQITDTGIVDTGTIRFTDYVVDLTSFLFNAGGPGLGSTAFSDRGLGNLARPFFADGLNGQPAGPLSKPEGEWSVFSTGLQLDLSFNAIFRHVTFAVGAAPTDIGPGCAGVAADGTPSLPGSGRLANGLQIFAGSVPIYRGSTLVGGIGVSGDGIDQDDMVAFLGLNNAASELGGVINNAPTDLRSDQLVPRNVRLRYVQCPQAPFVDGSEQTPCAGK